MKVIKGLCYGFMGGLSYAFVSFYLVTDYLRGNWVSIAFFGLQGFLYAAFLILFKRLAQRRITMGFGAHAVIGAVSGVLSCTYNVFLTYYGSLLAPSASGMVVPSQMRYALLSHLAHYTVGSLILGSLIGVLIGYKKRFRTASED